MAYSIWGFGTMFYGEADGMTDGSYITTEWIIALWIPIVPLVSLCVKSGGERTTNLGFYWSRSRSHTILYPVPLHWKQIGKTYAKVLAIIAGTIAGFGILKFLDQFVSVNDVLLALFDLALFWGTGCIFTRSVKKGFYRNVIIGGAIWVALFFLAKLFSSPTDLFGGFLRAIFFSARGM